MIVIGSDVVESYFANHAGHRGIKAARSQFDAWLDIVTRAEWRNPEDVKASYPKASILKAGRVVFNIKDNDYRLIARVQYQASVVMIRFFGTHAEYDEMTFDRKTYRIRINGRAGIRRDAESLGRHCGAKAVIRVECLDRYSNCPRYVPNLATSEGSIYVPRSGQTPPAPEWKRLPAVAPLHPDEDRQGATNGDAEG